MFYPENSDELQNTVTALIDAAKPLNRRIDLKGVVVPHAGYIFSGPVAATAYRALKDCAPNKTVFILAPSHYVRIGASVGAYDAYDTPLGPIKVDKTICAELLSKFDFIPEAHEREHSIEVQLPFLLNALKDFRIVPILLGEPSFDETAAILNPYFNNPKNIFVVSSDLSHYLPYEQANSTDKNSLKIITNLDTGNEDMIDACGHAGLKIIMRLARNNGYKMELLDYRNSGDTAGDKSGVVGYAAISIHKE